jgi:hypothetical protein
MMQLAALRPFGGGTEPTHYAIFVCSCLGQRIARGVVTSRGGRGAVPQCLCSAPVQNARGGTHTHLNEEHCSASIAEKTSLIVADRVVTSIIALL